MKLRRPGLKLVLRRQRRLARRDGALQISIGDGTFLQFLLDNWEEILQMIISIIGLFG